MRNWVVVLALLASGCSTISDMFDSKVDYKASGQLPPLEVPPDLTAPARDNRYVLPESRTATLSNYQQERKEQGRAAAGAVLPQIEHMRIERAGDARWLVVQEPPEKVWPLVRQFWLERGFLIRHEVPEAGVLETDWAENRANLPQDFIRGLLGRFAEHVYSTPERDKFRTRLERTADGKATEIYISHRGMQEVYTGGAERGNEGQTIWQARAPDPGLEAEFLRLMMVRLGADEERAKLAAVADPQPDRAQIVKRSDGSEALQVNEPFDRAWRRVGLALDRVGFTVEDRDRQNGLYFVRYADPESEMAMKDAQRGFLARLFSSADPKVKAEQYRVQVRQDDERSQVNVLNKEGGAETSRTAQRILSLLHEQLK
ncbi:MAG TPA: outer membrane protein assembly factor BamC [Burkholderiales bacterium]|nr:outer membrane protein assembly factor BamC [Burkholderiales bacterium]